MARAAQGQANALNKSAGGVASTATGNANQLFGNLFPQYQSEAMNPTGFGSSDLAAMNTASGESTGGSVAGAVGQGNLQAARTRNAGAFQAGADESARQGMRQNSRNALNTVGENARLKQSQRSEGLRGLSGLYGINEDQIAKMMGIQNEAINTETKAGQSGWLQNVLNIIQTLNPGYSKGGGLSFGG